MNKKTTIHLLPIRVDEKEMERFFEIGFDAWIIEQAKQKNIAFEWPNLTITTSKIDWRKGRVYNSETWHKGSSDKPFTHTKAPKEAENE